MPLDNYRDLSATGSDVGAGFQFEFFCSNCSRKWKSPFKPYRMGQLSGLINRFAFLISNNRVAGRVTGNFSDMGQRGARESALADATEHAETLYTRCSKCNKAVCADCYDTREQECAACLRQTHAEADNSNRRNADAAATQSAHACPNCRTPNAGGRFCAECGFDMASTHKSCPTCGTMVLRQARFCGDCGHGF